jgi:hypothetical protein
MHEREKTHVPITVGFPTTNAYIATAYRVSPVGIISLAAIRGGMPSPVRSV